MRTATLSLLLATAALALLLPTHAEACGVVFTRGATGLAAVGVTAKPVPSLQVEQVLVIHDPVKEEEHFIRQLAFRNASDPFGFVVPTPSRPTVAKVASSPFAELARLYPPEASELRLRLGSGGGAARGGRRWPGQHLALGDRAVAGADRQLHRLRARRDRGERARGLAAAEPVRDDAGEPRLARALRGGGLLSSPPFATSQTPRCPGRR